MRGRQHITSWLPANCGPATADKVIHQGISTTAHMKKAKGLVSCLYSIIFLIKKYLFPALKENIGVSTA